MKRIEEQVIWGDVLFAIDFSMDYLSLCLTQRLLGKPAGRQNLRLCTAAAICAGFDVLLVMLPGHPVFTIGISLASAGISCFLVLKEPLKMLWKGILLFLFTEGALGGILTAGYCLLNRIFYEAGLALPDYETKLRLFWLLAGAAAGLSSCVSVILRKHTALQHRKTAELSIRHKGREVHCSGFFDSGNLVKEPISGLPVIFLPQSCAVSLGIQESALSGGRIPGSRLIPMQTIHGASVSWAIHPDSILIRTDPEKAFRPTDGYLAFMNLPIRSENEQIQAILPDPL